MSRLSYEVRLLNIFSKKGWLLGRSLKLPGQDIQYPFLFLTSLGMSEVDTVLAWGGQTSTPPKSKYFSETFFPSHIRLTYNNPYKDFKSVERP